MSKATRPLSDEARRTEAIVRDGEQDVLRIGVVVCAVDVGWRRPGGVSELGAGSRVSLCGPACASQWQDWLHVAYPPRNGNPLDEQPVDRTFATAPIPVQWSGCRRGGF